MNDLGRRVPKDWEHVSKYRLAAVADTTVALVEDVLPLNHRYRDIYVQEGGACTGFSASWMMSILNHRLYDPYWLYHRAQQVDDWPETPPEEGSSVRAALDILRTEGHVRRYRGKDLPPSLVEGVIENRWATQVDEIRWCIANCIPVTLGIPWYANFDDPVQHGRDWFVGEGDLGRVRGGHAICCYGASDRRQAVKLVNSWGRAYPLIWLPYKTLQRLLDEEGEATMITDFIG